MWFIHLIWAGVVGRQHLMLHNTWVSHLKFVYTLCTWLPQNILYLGSYLICLYFDDDDVKNQSFIHTVYWHNVLFLNIMSELIYLTKSSLCQLIKLLQLILRRNSVQFSSIQFSRVKFPDHQHTVHVSIRTVYKAHYLGNTWPLTRPLSWLCRPIWPCKWMGINWF